MVEFLPGLIPVALAPHRSLLIAYFFTGTCQRVFVTVPLASSRLAQDVQRGLVQTCGIILCDRTAKHFVAARDVGKPRHRGAKLDVVRRSKNFGDRTILDGEDQIRAIQNFTGGLAQMLAEKGIRANAVAPGPIWTPLIPSTMPDDTVKNFGKQVPLKRAGQPAELATAYVMLADPLSSYTSGTTVAVTGGKPFI